MYSLDCIYYTKHFKTLNELLTDVVISGMDPSYEITFNDERTGELVINLIQF